MDSLTHIALGACIGEAFFGKKLGKKALVLGGMAQVVPDIDVLGVVFLSPAENLLFHRGLTHSFVFVLLAAPVLGLSGQRLLRRHQLPLPKLAVFFCVQLLLHILLDTCNAYGTKLLWPFTDRRFSFDLLFVADPFFLAPLLLGLLILLVLNKQHVHRKKWVAGCLLLSGLYLVYAVANKMRVNHQVEKSLQAQGLPHTFFISKPTAFNTWLWYIMVPAGKGFYIGYRSVFDSRHYVTPFEYFPQNKELLLLAENREAEKRLQTFSDGYFTVERRNDTVLVNVLRFGRIAGWEEKDKGFIVQFYLNPGFDNSTVMQRGRLREYNRETMRGLYRRIQGRKEDNSFLKKTGDK